MALKIYLADLVYDTVKTNFVVPLNIAYVTAYAKEIFKDDIEITLFKYPTELLEKIKMSPPDVLGLSHYSWNDRLGRFFLKLAKQINPNMVTVMGGPNVGMNPVDLKQFLEGRPELDYYVLNEGEKPFSNIIEVLLKANGPRKRFKVEGTASITEEGFHFQTIDFKSVTKELLVPSPYLGGLLDKFLKDPDMMPLLETNRGCPYGCVYCEWGSAALSKIKDRPTEQVYEEMDYIAKVSAEQKVWIMCDANFGIKERDLDFARHIRHIKNQYGFPAEVIVWHSKNTTERNIEIVEMLGDGASGYIAIQSADEEVLRLAGRGAIKLDRLKQFIQYYKDRNLPVSTDILIGLPGESAASHLKTLCDAFSIGFTKIEIYNIRMLAGTSYSSKESRTKYQVKVKYRPVFGGYGVYNGEKVFEMEESVRSTKDMSEIELNNFKILHWLVYLAWNSGLFKNHLKLAQHYGLNPAQVLHQLTQTKEPVLKAFFDRFLQESLNEWFETPEDMQKYYNQDENFNRMVTYFSKLNFYYIAQAFQDSKIITSLKNELERIIKSGIQDVGENELNELLTVIDTLGEQLLCRNPFQPSLNQEFEVSGKIASVIFEKPEFMQEETVRIKIFRTETSVELCKNFFKDPSNTTINEWLRFLENVGMKILTNQIEPVFCERV